MSNFKSDLNNEQILSRKLDTIYDKMGINFTRIHDLESQYMGIDGIIKFKDEEIRVDEKAQIHYLNKSLPTFAFELSYLRNNSLRYGWLHDKKKVTELYLLITAIKLKNSKPNLTSPDDVESLNIIAIDRHKLLKFLNKIGLSKKKLRKYDKELRASNHNGAKSIKELDSVSEGKLYFTHYLQEKPINLVLKLDNLIKHGIATKIY